MATKNWPRSRLAKLALALAATLAGLAHATAVWAQGCAMCYNTAAAAKAAAIQALRSGILILLVPVALMFIAIFVLTFRSKERFTELYAESVDCGQERSYWFESLPLQDSQTLVVISPQRTGEGELIRESGPCPFGGVPQGPGERVMRRGEFAD